MNQMTKLGRPTSYTPEIGRRVCEAIAVSQHGLRKTLEDDPELPAYGTVLGWRHNHADFQAEYSRAKKMQLEAMAEDIVDIANSTELDANDKRVQIDTRKWLLSKLIPKTYGDKIDVTSGGEALAAPSHQIDARVQSIIMQAMARREGATRMLPQLPDEAASLLE